MAIYVLNILYLRKKIITIYYDVNFVSYFS